MPYCRNNNYNQELKDLIERKGFRHDFLEQQLGVCKTYLSHLLHDKELSEEAKQKWLKRIDDIHTWENREQAYGKQIYKYF